MQDPNHQEYQHPVVQQPVVQQPVVQHIHHFRPAKDPGTAVILELLPGIMMQTFGIGNIYAGNVAGGILMMIGYWVAQFINFLLCFVVVGFLTLPLTWIAFMIFCPITASNSARRNSGMV